MVRTTIAAFSEDVLAVIRALDLKRVVLIGHSLGGPVILEVARRAPERPLRLFHRPEPIDVPVTEVPEGPPLNFRWRRAMHRVARAEGPERIAPEWWLHGKPEVKADENEKDEAVLKDWGFAAAEIAALGNSGVIGIAKAQA